MISQEIFTRIGFTQKEAHVYLACLELGSGTVLQISRKADVTRGSCYDVLQSMLERGLVSKIEGDRGLHFSAVDPDILLKRTEQNVRELELALPELKGLFHQHARPKVRYFEGIEGIKRVYLDTLTATTEILNYANSKEVRHHWPTYDEEYIQLRYKKGIFLKGIYPDDELGQRVKSLDGACLRETRLLSSKEFRFTNEINIYDNKVAITSFESELIGILIESKQIADTQREIFKMAWAYAGMNQDNGSH